jgi:hypothetical protein
MDLLREMINLFGAVHMYVYVYVGAKLILPLLLVFMAVQ